MAISLEQFNLLLENMQRSNVELLKSLMEDRAGQMDEKIAAAVASAKMSAETHQEKKPSDLGEKVNGKLKMKDFIGMDKMERRDQWDQWSWGMKYRIRAENPDFAKMLDEVEKTAEKDLEDLKVKNGDVENGEKRSAELYGILSDKVTGEAMTHVRSTKEGDGLLAWKRLHANFNPKTLSGTLMKIIDAIRPNKCTDMKRANMEILEWEKKWQDAIEDVGNISQKGRMAILASIIPDDVYEVVIQNVKEGDETHEDLKERIRR